MPAHPYIADRAETLRYLGYTGQQVDSSLNDRIDLLIGECERTATPGFRYRIFPARITSTGVVVEGTSLVLEGADIRAHMTGAREVALMTCTLGLANERAQRRYATTSGLDAFVFGAAGSALVEAVADACNAAIVAEARSRGLHCNWRYSPGYGDLPLSAQPAIVRILDATRALGVTVTDSNLLVPAKTVTAAVGLFDTPQSDRRSCANCSFFRYCTIRREGNPCYR
ncbi:vitamin B12 dependent methionine synthase [Eggerthellaceae bacterium zg-997]|nr:vitamin B12 dependent methionine synthase [Eggerthellaceae bacterium zg-997]